MFRQEIQYIEPVLKNKRDTEKQIFELTGDPTETIKWCRRNFGARGDGWDFYGRHGKQYAVEIWSTKLIVMWKLWKD